MVAFVFAACEQEMRPPRTQLTFERRDGRGVLVMEIKPLVGRHITAEYSEDKQRRLTP